MNKGSRSLKSREQVVAITAILLIIITASAAYIYQTDPWIKENIQLLQAKRKLDAPQTAEYLGKHTYNISNQPNTVYTWKNKTTLYEAQITPEGTIKTHTYTLKPDELNATMSPYIAQAIAEQLLGDTTQYLPEQFTISDPTYTYSNKYFDQGGTWRIRWGLKIENYPILGAGFSVRVSTETGKARINVNSFSRTIGLTLPSLPGVTEDQAIEIATESYLKSLDYPVVQSATVRELGITLPGYVETPPNALVWNIVVSGMGYENGNMVHRSTVYSIDAHTGENYIGLSVGSGITTIGSYPYYGSAYPLTTHRYPHDYEFPIPLEEAKDLVYHYAEEGLPQDVAWENIILTLDDENQPLIVSFWVRAYDDFKTGTLNPPDSLRDLERDKQLLDGYMIIIDPVNGTLLHAEEILNIGPQSLSLNVSRDDAINILKNSSKTDLKGNIIKDEALKKTEPRIIIPNWMMQLGHIGDYDHLYLTRNNVSKPRLYWLIEYASNEEIHVGGNTGRYLVDAETGELVLAVEDHPLPYLLFKVTEPEKVTLIQGESTTFNVTVSALPTFDAVLPVTISPDQNPDGVSVSFDSERKPISNEFPAEFTVTLRSSTETLPGTYFTVIKVSGPGFSTSAHFDLEIKPSAN